MLLSLNCFPLCKALLFIQEFHSKKFTKNFKVKILKTHPKIFNLIHNFVNRNLSI